MRYKQQSVNENNTFIALVYFRHKIKAHTHSAHIRHYPYLCLVRRWRMPNDMRIHSGMSLFTPFKLNLLKFVHMRNERALYTNVYKIAFAALPPPPPPPPLQSTHSFSCSTQSLHSWHSKRSERNPHSVWCTSENNRWCCETHAHFQNTNLNWNLKLNKNYTQVYPKLG